MRVEFDEYGILYVAHGLMRYKIDFSELCEYLKWLNDKGDCYVRVIHEVRSESKHTELAVQYFREFCTYVSTKYTSIKFWCGRNLYNWEIDYDFGEEPTCEENHASVMPPYLLDDWFPWIYAKKHNHEIYENGTDKDILLIDFVNIK